MSHATGPDGQPFRPMIRLEGVTKIFPGASAPAVDGLTLDIPRGELVCLVGPSGCGKTTTLKMINRLVEPTGGTITVAGREIRSVPPHDLRRGIGYVIQQVGLFRHKTIVDNIATVPKLLGWDPERIARRTEELMELVGLSRELARRYPAELSGGQQQRVGVARSLAADPPVLLMDEPFAAVDPIVRSRLQDELSELQAAVGKTIVFVTHDVDEAIRLADRVAILNQGGLLEQYDTPTELLRSPSNTFVEEFLGGERGLKRLSLIDVVDVDLQGGPVLDAGAGIEEAKQVMTEHGTEWIGVLDAARLRGWLWASDLDPGRTVGDHTVRNFNVWIDSRATLRRALDAIVNTRNQVAVVYEGDRYLGMLFIESLSETLFG